MKQNTNENVTTVKGKVVGKVKTFGRKAVDFGKEHWKGIVGTVVATGVIGYARRRLNERTTPEPMNFEEDTIENAKIDFGEDYENIVPEEDVIEEPEVVEG